MSDKTKNSLNNRSNSERQTVVRGYVIPTQPHPLLAPQLNPGYQKIKQALEEVRRDLEASAVDLIIIYSTQWASVLGHQIQARPEVKWTLVDDEWHELGSLDYTIKFDSEFAHACKIAGEKRGLHLKTVDYHGFPIDTGSVVALQFINPDNRIPVVIVSSNVYADRSETVVLAKAFRDVLAQQGKTAAVVASTMLSNRSHSEVIAFADDFFASKKDHEWNQKILEFLSEGRLEDVAQLSRQFHKEARVQKVNNFKPFWFMSAMLGNHNRFHGKVYEYQPIYGMGAAVVGLTPSDKAFGDLEYDEENPEYFLGDRNVLSSHNIENVTNDDLDNSSTESSNFSKDTAKVLS